MTKTRIVKEETKILTAIADKKNHRKEIAGIYAHLIQLDLSSKPVSRHHFDWGKINHAIIDRWSHAALIYIKERAWKIVS